MGPKLVITSFGSKSKYGESRWKTNLGKNGSEAVFLLIKNNQIASFTGLFDDSGEGTPKRFAGNLLFYDSCHVGNEILRCKSLPIPIFRSFSGLWLEISIEKVKMQTKTMNVSENNPSHFLLEHETKIMVPRWNHPTWEVNKNQQRILLGIEHPPFLGHQLKPKDLPRVELWTIKYQPIGSTRSHVFLIRKSVGGLVDLLRHHQYSNPPTNQRISTTQRISTNLRI